MSRRKISLNALMETLFNVPVPVMTNSTIDSEVKPTTVRPDARTVHFFSYHADRLGISMQDMMALSMNAIVSATTVPVRTEFQLAVDRFKHVFDAHKIPHIHAKQIIDSTGDNNFPLGGMTNDKIFLENYTPAVKEALSNIFGVRTDWLSGTGERAVVADPIYSRDFVYRAWDRLKNPVKLKGIETINRNLLLLTSDNDKGIGENDEMPFEVLLFTLVEYAVDARMKFKSFHLCGILPLANKEARIGLQAILQSVSQSNEPLNVQGVTYSQDAIHGIKLGLLPTDCFDEGFPTSWDTDCLLVKPGEDSEIDMLTELLITSN